MPELTYESKTIHYRAEGDGELLVLLPGNTSVPSIEADYRTLARRVPEARVVLTDEGGHPLMWARPELFHAEALGFLEAP